MNKIEFLEILKDYLKKELSEEEVSDILRDYEEYFIDGVMEGKSDMEIIQGLGSPKSIANELILQLRENSYKEISKKDKINDKLNLYKLRAKDKFNKSKNYISNKLTPNLEDKYHKNNRKWIQVVLVILSLFLVLTLVGIGITLIAFIVTYIVTMIITFNFITATREITALYIFGSIAFIGGQILAWQIYIFLINLCIKISKNYINWIKTRNLYINASKKKEQYENESNNEINIDYYDKEEEDKDE